MASERWEAYDEYMSNLYVMGYDSSYDINKNVYKIRVYALGQTLMSFPTVSAHCDISIGQYANNQAINWITCVNSRIVKNLNAPYETSAYFFDKTYEYQPTNSYDLMLNMFVTGFDSYYSRTVSIDINNTAPKITTSVATSHNTCNLSWNSDINLQNITVKIANDTLKTVTSINSKSGVISLTGLLPNSTYTLTVIGRRYNSTITGTTTKVITTTNFPAITSSLNFNIGNNLSVNLSSKFALNYNIKVTISNTVGSSLEYTISVPTTSQSVTLDVISVMNALYKLATSDKTLTIKMQQQYTGTNYNGQSQTSAGSIYTGTATVVNSNPTFSTFNCANTDAKTLSLLGNNQYLMQRYGNLNVLISKVNKASPINFATIHKYVCEIRQKTVNGTLLKTQDLAYYSDLDISINFGAIDTNEITEEKIFINIYAVDSRGFRSSTVSKSITLLPYQVPSINFSTLERFNEFEQEVVWDFDSYYSILPVDGVQKNTKFEIKARVYEFGTAASGGYTIISISQSNISNLNSYTKKAVDIRNDSTSLFKNLNREKSYYIEFVLTDAYTSYTFLQEIHAGISILGILDDGHVTINRLPNLNSPGLLQVGSDILATNDKGQDVLLVKKAEELAVQLTSLNTILSSRIETLNNSLINANNKIDELNRNITPVNYSLVSYNTAAISIVAITLKKCGSICTINGYIKVDIAISAKINFMHIDPGIDPATKVYFCITNSSATSPAYCILDTGGYIFADSSIQPGYYFFNFTYMQ